MSLDAFQKLNQNNADYHANGSMAGIFVKGGDVINHVGFLYAFEDKKPDTGEVVKMETRELHFITNRRIIHDPVKPTKQYLHAPMGLHHINAVAFAGYLTAVSRQNKHEPPILYGMDWAGAKNSFDIEGKYLKPESIAGLTCATFVSELITTFLGEPVNLKSWPDADPDDLGWRDRTLAEYRERIAQNSTSITLEQVKAMADITPFIRLRPEQIAAVATSDMNSWAVDHELAQQLAEQVTAIFDAAFAKSYGGTS